MEYDEESLTGTGFSARVKPSHAPVSRLKDESAAASDAPLFLTIDAVRTSNRPIVLILLAHQPWSSTTSRNLAAVPETSVAWVEKPEQSSIFCSKTCDSCHDYTCLRYSVNWARTTWCCPYVSGWFISGLLFVPAAATLASLIVAGVVVVLAVASVRDARQWRINNKYTNTINDVICH